MQKSEASSTVSSWSLSLLSQITNPLPQPLCLHRQSFALFRQSLQPLLFHLHPPGVGCHAVSNFAIQPFHVLLGNGLHVFVQTGSTP